MQRHIFLIPGFFGFANLGDFAYWGPVFRQLNQQLDGAGLPAHIHCVPSLPTASLRARTRSLLESIARVRPHTDAAIHLIGHSTGGLDARLLLSPGVNLETRMDVEAIARRVCSSISIATPHRGAPIASFFTGLLGRKLLHLLSIVTMTALRGAPLPLHVWVEIAGLFAVPPALGEATGSLASQLYQQLLSDFNPERREQVSQLLGHVQNDQSLLTQLTVESMDIFNSLAIDRAHVAYGAVITQARPPSLNTSLEIGFDFVEQAQQALYYSLSQLARGYRFPSPNAQYQSQLIKSLGALPDSDANDGIVPTNSQPWGDCIAVARADHLDIIGHHGGSETDVAQHFDWLSTHSEFRSEQFIHVWQRVAQFIARSETARSTPA